MMMMISKSLLKQRTNLKSIFLLLVLSTNVVVQQRLRMQKSKPIGKDDVSIDPNTCNNFPLSRLLEVI